MAGLAVALPIVTVVPGAWTVVALLPGWVGAEPGTESLTKGAATCTPGPGSGGSCTAVPEKGVVTVSGDSGCFSLRPSSLLELVGLQSDRLPGAVVLLAFWLPVLLMLFLGTAMTVSGAVNGLAAAGALLRPDATTVPGIVTGTVRGVMTISELCCCSLRPPEVLVTTFLPVLLLPMLTLVPGAEMLALAGLLVLLPGTPTSTKGAMMDTSGPGRGGRGMTVPVKGVVMVRRCCCCCSDLFLPDAEGPCVEEWQLIQ